MKNTHSTFVNCTAAILTGLLLTACGGGGGGGGGGASTGTASISLTDAPIDDAKEVVVRFDGAEFQPANGARVMVYLSDTTGTCEVVTVPDTTKPCEVDLTDYTGNNKVTLLDNVTLPAGPYSWVRLILNANPGYITLLNDSQFDLRVPSGAQTGLKLHGGFIVATGNHTDYTIDFDLRKSVHDPVGSSDYILRPTLRMVDNSLIGTLSGNVHPSFFEGGLCTGAVYVFPDGTPGTPDDVDGDDSDPITAALVPNDGTHAYTVGFLTEGDYLIAFTCDALADVPTVDDGAGTVDFLSQATVHITAGANTVFDFLPAP